MDEGSDRPEPDRAPEESFPPPTPSKKRRHPVVLGIVIGAIAMFAGLGAIGYFAATESELPLEEDFSSDEPEFTTDEDPMVAFSVADGAYHIVIKQSGPPQIARHIFNHSYDGLRIDSTVTMPDSGAAVFSLGCWAGEHAYLLALISDGEVGLIETGSQGEGGARQLTNGTRSEALHSLNEPNRLRLDCVGGGSDPTIVSGWVNGTPVLSVEVPDGYDSFNAVGFFVGAETNGAEFVVDDVLTVDERPEPAVSPVPPIS